MKEKVSAQENDSSYGFLGGSNQHLAVFGKL